MPEITIDRKELVQTVESGLYIFVVTRVDASLATKDDSAARSVQVLGQAVAQLHDEQRELNVFAGRSSDAEIEEDIIGKAASRKSRRDRLKVKKEDKKVEEETPVSNT